MKHNEDGEEMDTSPPDAGLTIPVIHIAFESIHKRIQLFSQLVQAWPECVNKLFESKALETTVSSVNPETWTD